MADMSNKSLSLLLVAAIVISLGGTLLSLNKLSEVGVITGRATDPTGEVNLTITTNASCAVDVGVNFSSGVPTTSRQLSTDINNNFDGFSCDGSSTGACSGIEVNNTGNVDLNVTFNSSKNGSGFLGGDHAVSDFLFLIDDTEIEANACTTEGASSWTNVNLTDMILCTGLESNTSNNVVIVDFNVSIDENTPAGTKQATMNINCIQAP